MPTSAPSVAELLRGREPSVSATYIRLIEALNRWFAVTEEANKSSIHLKPKGGGSAFAGVHPRRAAILLNVRGDAPIVSPRIRKVKQVSKHRFHNELLLESPSEVDADLLAWLSAAYALSAPTD
ncbi:MAG: DUF5655 domain-containing protein [Gemmatimonadaceae bacterium]